MPEWASRPLIGPPVLLAPYLDPGDASPLGGAGYAQLQAAVSGLVAWGVANRAFYLPVYVLAPTVIVSMIWRNGGTLNGNVDVGIYTRTFQRLASSGAVAQAGINAVQSATVSVTLSPELYYLGISAGTTTGIYWRWTYGATLGPLLAQSCGIRMEDTAHPLPATATPVKPTADLVPMLAATGRVLI